MVIFLILPLFVLLFTSYRDFLPLLFPLILKASRVHKHFLFWRGLFIYIYSYVPRLFFFLDLVNLPLYFSSLVVPYLPSTHTSFDFTLSCFFLVIIFSLYLYTRRAVAAYIPSYIYTSCRMSTLWQAYMSYTYIYSLSCCVSDSSASYRRSAGL